MVSVDDAVREFLECAQTSMGSYNEEERKTLQKVMQKCATELCYIIVPDVENLISERGIFQPATPEKAMAMKSFYNEQRKAFFALAAGILNVRSQIDRIELGQKEAMDVIAKQLQLMENRINGMVRMGNTVLSTPPKTPPTRTVKK